METYELATQHDSRASFYRKAIVMIETNKKTLRSYNTDVAEIHYDVDGVNVARVFGTYSTTTLRHIKEFLLQNGFRADNKAQILKDYSI